ncbi:TetR/AcrR family transcriptional regulator [Streptomyces litmocidini]|uniref:TetR/AcrR family transcriptional regulator n=1 Tax=Streptomyces TaxID=1883 RepID=UPI000F484AC5|nr:TetR/AcrR family transcriptional regulator [Streptomyces sp. PanSC19]ROQ34973.1 TetR family transcriptional regulator [Streptomyces sp. PanSC19]
MEDTPATTVAQPQGRRERNKLRVKNRIYEAALDLFTQKGYDQTSVDEITEKADVARGTFFNHFQRKEDLIAEWGEQRRLQLRRGLDAEGIPHTQVKDIRVALSRCMSILAAVSLENPLQTKAVLTAWVRAGFPLHEQPYVAHMFGEFIEAGQRIGDISQDVDACLAGNLLRDVYLGTLYRWTQAPEGRADLEADLQSACATLLDGLLPRCPSTK